MSTPYTITFFFSQSLVLSNIVACEQERSNFMKKKKHSFGVKENDSDPFAAHAHSYIILTRSRIRIFFDLSAIAFD